MFSKTNFYVPQNLLDQAVAAIPDIDFKLTINQPTGRFFYDPWEVKKEFENTIWNDILKTLPSYIGEARIICLSPAKCYQSHADIDDRFHLNISGDEYSYLVNLESEQMFKIIKDNYWYTLDTSPRHSAINFGKIDRVQLVVRHLLKENKIDQSIFVKVSINELDDNNSRFLMDDVISPWLNKKSKCGKISDFNFTEKNISFKLDSNLEEELYNIIPKSFKLEILK